MTLVGITMASFFAAALLLRALQGAGAGVVDVANAATIAEVVPASHRGRAFGSFYGARTIAMAIGPFIGGFAGVAGMRWVFLVAAGASLIAIVPIVLFLPKRRPATAEHEPTGTRLRLWRNRSLLGVLVAFATVGLVVGVYEVCWSLLLAGRGRRHGRSDCRGRCSPSRSPLCRSPAAGSWITSTGGISSPSRWRALQSSRRCIGSSGASRS